MCYIEQDNDGVNCYSNIGGYSGSSARTELAAGILAILAHGPIHVASDNKGFVSKAIKLINRVNDKNDQKINCGVQKDGDLWQIMHNAIKAKSTRAFKISWAKGHANEEHVQRGLCTKEDVIGNDLADRNADKGALVFGQTIHDVAKWLHARHDAYARFMKKVAIHIVEAYLIHRNKLDSYVEHPNAHNVHEYKDPST